MICLASSKLDCADLVPKIGLQLQMQAQQCGVHHNGDWKSLLTRSPGFDDSVLTKTVGGQ